MAIYNSLTGGKKMMMDEQIEILGALVGCDNHLFHAVPLDYSKPTDRCIYCGYLFSSTDWDDLSEISGCWDSADITGCELDDSGFCIDPSYWWEDNG